MAVPIWAGLTAYGVEQQTPVGGIDGVAVSEMTKNPLGKASVSVFLDGKKVEEAVGRSTVADASGHYSFRRLPTGRYRIAISTKAHRLEQVVNVEEGKIATFDKPIPPVAPFADCYVSERIFTPTEKPSFEINAFGGKDKIDLRVYKIRLDKIIERKGLGDLLSAYAKFKWDESVRLEQETSKAIELSKDLPRPDGEGVRTGSIKLDPMKPGFYLVKLRAGEIVQSSYFIVSDFGLVMKQSYLKDQQHVMAVDLASGQPLPGVPIKQGMQSVTTNEDGIATLTKPSGDSQDVITAQHGENVAVIEARGFEKTPETALKIAINSDRPVYKPGDTVRLRGVARKVVGDTYGLPGPRQFTLEARDNEDNTVAKTTVMTDDRGNFEATVPTKADIPSGGLSINVTDGSDNRGSHYVAIADYRKPLYSVTVKGTKPRFKVGEPVSAEVQVDYFYGAPAANAKIMVTLTKSDWSSMGDEDSDEGYGAESGSYLDSQEATTDGSGHAIVKFKTRDEDETGKAPVVSDGTYYFSAEVTDSSDEYVRSTGKADLVQGDFALDVEPASWWCPPGRPLEVTLSAKNHADKTPATGADVTVKAVLIEPNDEVTKETVTEQATAKLGSDGTATLSITPKDGGSYRLDATTRDRSGNEIVSHTYLYVEGGSWSQDSKSKRFDLTVEKSKVGPGEKVSGAIVTSAKTSAIWLTVEGDGVKLSKVLPVTGPVTHFEFNAEKSWGVRPRVMATAISNKEIFRSGVNLKISERMHTLKVNVTADRAEVQPGEKVVLSVETKDETGKPVPADTSIAVVDESVFAVREDRQNLLDDFYPNQDSSVDTSYSFERVYLDGGDKAGHIKVRRNFKDTAFWRAQVRTGPDGKGRVELTLPDNTTSWRASAIAISDQTEVGSARTSVIARKALQVRISAPQTLGVGDSVEIPVAVQNNTKEVQKVNLQITGVDLPSPATLEIPIGESRTQVYQLTPKSVGPVSLVAKAWVDGTPLNDGVEERVQVRPAGTLVVDSQSGDASNAVKISRLNGSQVGTVDVVVQRSLGEVMFASMQDLVAYPYGCVEQTTSRMVAAILVKNSLGDGPSPRPDLTNQVPEIVRLSVKRLRSMQNPDGGWSWFGNGDSEPYMSAIALEGLAIAKQSGFAVPDEMLKIAKDYATKELKKPEPAKPTDPNDKVAAVAYRWKQRERAQLANALGATGGERVKFNLDTSDPMQAVYGVQIGHYYQDRKLIDTSLATLQKAMTRSGQDVYWSGTDTDTDELTAVTAKVLALEDPTDPRVVGGIRYLLRKRRGFSWLNTNVSRLALQALAAYLPAQKDQAGPTKVTLMLNGAPVGNWTLDVAGQRTAKLKLDLTSLRPGENEIKLTSSSGNAFFAVNTTQWGSPEDLAKLSNTSRGTVKVEYFRMIPNRQNDSGALIRESQPTTTFNSGELVQQVITVETKTVFDTVLVNSPVPPVLFALDSTEFSGDWPYMFEAMDVRQAQIDLFDRAIEPGKTQYVLTFRAEAKGTSQGASIAVQNMYDPAQRIYVPIPQLTVR
jgi:hypothetical protein